MRNSGKFIHIGLLIIRIGMGIVFFFHGLPKLMGGVEAWRELGSAMTLMGVSFAPVFWGFMATFAETVGAILLILGLFHRFVAFMLAFTMIIAMLMHFDAADTYFVYSHTLKALIVFIALLISGPGRYSLDYVYFRKIA